MRLHPAHMKTAKRKWEDKSGSDSGIISDGRGRAYGYTCPDSGAEDYLYKDGIPRDKNNDGKSSVNPYSCVNIVEKIKSEQLKRKENQNCDLERGELDTQTGSTHSLPVQSFKNVSYQPSKNQAKSSGRRLDLIDKTFMMEKNEPVEGDSNDESVDEMGDEEGEIATDRSDTLDSELDNLDEQQLKSLTSYLKFMNGDNLALGEMLDSINFSLDSCECQGKQTPVVNGYITEAMLQNHDKECRCKQVSDQKKRTLNELRRKFPNEFMSNGTDLDSVEHNLPSHFFHTLSRNPADPARTTEL